MNSTSNIMFTIIESNLSTTSTTLSLLLQQQKQQQALINADIATLNLVNLYINDIIGSILFTFGLLFNVLSFTYFQLSKSFRDTSMRHYFSVLSISDSLRLSEWLFTILMDKKIIFLDKNICRAFLFITITSGHVSVWLLVFLSIERYIILQFPFRGKQFYTTKNSLRMLFIVIIIIIIIDIPYLMPSFIERQYINYTFHLHMCITNPKFRSYMFINNVLLYSIIPFIILLVFNCLLISLIARQNTQLFNIIQTGNSALNAKRERQFKERTILLMLVTFFLVLTVSPRYIIQMLFMFISYQSLSKVTIAKCLIILEMLNFSMNFFFYIICSKTSRNELFLILYYFFYWKWSSKSKKLIICNHPNHNPNNTFSNSLKYTSYRSNQHNNALLNNNNTIDYETNLNIFNENKKKTRMKIYCFLLNAAKLKKLENTTNINNNNNYNTNNQTSIYNKVIGGVANNLSNGDMLTKNLSLSKDMGDSNTASTKISLQSKSKSSSPRSLTIFTKSQLKSHNHDLLGENYDKSNEIKLLNYKVNEHITYI